MPGEEKLRASSLPLRLTQLDFRLKRAVDVKGRPIAELSAEESILEKARAAGVPFQERSSAYHRDLRTGMENWSAYVSLNSVSPQVLQDLAYISSLYFGNNRPTEISGQDLYHLAAIAYATASYLINRSNNAIDPNGGIPEHIAGLAKVSLGLLTVGIMHKDYPINPDAVYAVANGDNEINHLLTVQSITRRSCPAPQRKIIEHATALLTGKIDIKNGDPTESKLAEYFPQDNNEEFLNLFRYATPMAMLMTSLDELTSNLMIETLQAAKVEEAQRDSFADEYYMQINQALPRISVLVSRMNLALGRPGNARFVTREEVEEFLGVTWSMLMEHIKKAEQTSSDNQMQ